MQKNNDKQPESKANNDKPVRASSTNVRDSGRVSPAPTKEAIRALNSGLPDAIVDIKVSLTEQHENDLSRNGYVQLLQDDAKLAKSKKVNIASSTFGNRSSLWTWNRAQGTCSGRLKPVIDIQLDPSPSSSDLVLAGYLCDPVMISGQHLWIKRASNDEEEKDAIVDLYVTTGRMKDTSDPVWSSPGVGWIRVDGNFSKSMFGSVDSILWFRPARTRSIDSHMVSPSHSSVGLSEEIRLTKIYAATRLAIRNFVPVPEMKRLSNLVLEASSPNASTNAANTNIVRSERMADFSIIFHQYAQKAKLYIAKLTKMLLDTGVNLSKPDITQVFNYFDVNHNGFISIEEYTKTLTLTDFELDLAVERIRVKLLCTSSTPAQASLARTVSRISAGVSKPSVGVIGAGSIVAHGSVGRNKIRENLSLLNVFGMINLKNDMILSIDEIMDLASKTEQFFTEEEAGKFLKMMDLDGDDRIEEGDFVAFMRRDSNSITRKAFRVRESAAMLRRWLVRGTSEKMAAASTATASKQQWKDFKTKYEKSTGLKFPGYLSVQVLISQLGSLGVRLSAIEARELTLMMAPEKNGRIHQSDLHSFMGRTCRPFGELIALLERDLLKDLFDSYRAYVTAFKALGKEDVDLAEQYRKKLSKVQTSVEMVFNKPPPVVVDMSRDPHDAEDGKDGELPAAPAPAPAPAADQRYKKSSHEVISVAQLKAGIEDFCKESGIPETTFPNLEEWAALSILVDADVAEGDIYGVRLRSFLEGLCVYELSTVDEFKMRSGEKVSLEIVSRDLKRQIWNEAHAAGRGKKADYRAVFDLFDQDKNGAITGDEFKNMLKKLQLIPSLSDHQIPQLLGMFDKGKKNMIVLDDFIAFAEDYARISGGTAEDGLALAGEENELGDFGEEGDEDDDLEGVSSNVPPVKITKNADCDWLLWFLYRQAYKIEPSDPESVISELQNTCSEAEMIVRNQASISSKEFWNILFEKQLQGNMTKAQFIKGIQLVCSEGSGRDDDRVDYDTLCRSCVRMGRAFNEILQERAKADQGKFVPLVLELKKYFKDLSEEMPIEKGDRNERNPTPRYEKIFRRLDTDGDGMLTMREFKIGLRRLHYKDEKSWTMRMIRRLFDECDKNRDGLLSIKEFNSYILDNEGPSRYEIARGITQHDERSSYLKGSGGGSAREDEGYRKQMKSQEDKLNLSDDEEDEVFRKHRVLTDHELIRKVNEILHDVVPVEEHAKHKHTETVKASVRRFFQRADPDHKGHVSEERFRAFLRRSTLQDGLTTSELRRLTDRLKKKHGKAEEAINYEKLLQMLHYSVETIPKSKAEVIFARFQDAAIASANSGRPFLSLCSLVDLRLTGKVTREELMVTAKMMDCPLTHYDVEAMLEMFPNEVQSREGHIDYRLIQNLLQTYTPRVAGGGVGGAHDLDRRPSRNGALPSYSSPHRTLNVQPNDVNGSRWMHRSINTPLGNSLTTPFNAYNDALSNRPGGIAFSNTSRNLFPARAGVNMMGNSPSSGFNVYERQVKLIVERIKLAVEEQSRVYNTPVSIRRQFEIYDNDNTGMVFTRTMQTILDEIGVSLSAPELQAIYHIYGRPEDDKIYYESLCRAVDNAYALVPSQSLYDNIGERGGGDSRTGAAMEKFVPYLSAKVLSRLRDLKAEGRDPRDVFEAFDAERDGLIPAHKFKEVIMKLQLLQTEHQLTKALEDFSSINNRSYVMYEDFCTALDRSLAATGNVRRSRQTTVNGSGYDGFRGGRDESLYGGDNIDEPTNVYDSLQRFKFDNGMSPAVARDYPVELEDGSDSLFNRLDPPKVTDSYSLNRHGIASSPTRYGGSGGGRNTSLYGNTSSRTGSYDAMESPRRSTSSIQAPRTSPSKVGQKMWGSQTPLNKKGTALRVGEDKWCCVVCLYVENAIGRTTCAVCDAPNYNTDKNYQVKEQCSNCTYLNGQFADECEMCGEPLSSSSRGGSKKLNSSSNNNSYKLKDDSHRDRYSGIANNRYSRDSSW